MGSAKPIEPMLTRPLTENIISMTNCKLYFTELLNRQVHQEFLKIQKHLVVYQIVPELLGVRPQPLMHGHGRLP